MPDPVNGAEGAAQPWLAGHVPDALVHGPVSSRRFGRSLGISFSDPGSVACRWRCAYCQLGSMTYRPGFHAPADAIIAAAIARLTASDGGVDAVTFAGSGEPLDHPHFAEIVAAIAPAAHARGLRTVLLTNGDGIGDATVRRALAEHIDLAYVKWDPGAPNGAWRTLDGVQAAQRWSDVSSLHGLRVQAMLYAKGTTSGNSGDAARTAWIADLARLHPIEVHLTTVERAAPHAPIRAVEQTVLDDWKRAGERVLGVTIHTFAARSAA